MAKPGDEVVRTEPAPISALNLPLSPQCNSDGKGGVGVPIETCASRVEVISTILLDHHPMLPELAASLGGGSIRFESRIRGGSMAPAIACNSRLRLQLNANQPLRPGDIVLFLSDRGFMVHRVVCQSPRHGAGGYLLTLGDNCLAPDPPVRKDRMMGVVVAVKTPNGWLPPGVPTAVSRPRKLIRAATTGLTIATLWCNVAAAQRLATILLQLEDRSRVLVRHFLRRFRVTFGSR